MLTPVNIDIDTLAREEASASPDAYVCQFVESEFEELKAIDSFNLKFSDFVTKEDKVDYSNHAEESSFEIAQKMEKTPSSWSSRLKKEFANLAAKYSLGQISVIEEERLAELITTRRSILTQMTAEDVLYQIERRKKEKSVQSAISDYFEFIKVKSS